MEATCHLRWSGRIHQREPKASPSLLKIRTRRPARSIIGVFTTSWASELCCRRGSATASRPKRRGSERASMISASRATMDPLRRRDTEPHHYHFKLAALDVETLSRAPKMSVADIWKSAEKHRLAQAELVGVYSR